MKHIIQEHLSALKESDELDKILPDLLHSMGITPISLPQKGTRQYGVDVVAKGKNEQDNQVLYFFIIKRGDIGRKEWDGNSQAIRSSLDEIKDVFFKKVLTKEQMKLPKLIILVTGGIIKQEVLLNWNSYTEEIFEKDKIKIDIWNGYNLSEYIEKYMLNEKMLPGNYRSSLRKTLDRIDDPDYDMKDYFSILTEILLEDKGKSIKIEKVFRLINLILNIIYYWAKSKNNLNPALIAAERTLLNVWEYLRKNNSLDQKDFGYMSGILITFNRIYIEYFIKMREKYLIYDGLNSNIGIALLGYITTFDQLGIASITGLLHFYLGSLNNDQYLLDVAKNVMDHVKELIIHHSVLSSPIYDNHIIEISLAIILLSSFSENSFVKSWIDNMINKIAFAYEQMGCYFPIQSDSLEDAVSLCYSGNPKKEDMIQSSTLLPILLQWCVVLEFEDTYSDILYVINSFFHSTTMQIWYPDKDTDKHLYKENAGFSSGIGTTYNGFPDNAKDMIEIMKKGNESFLNDPDLISSMKHGFPLLPLISSRHFRTPILPNYWALSVEEKTFYDKGGSH
jgi:hypothetical protein